MKESRWRFQLGEKLYNYAYGSMTVVECDSEYVTLTIDDPNGCFDSPPIYKDWLMTERGIEKIFLVSDFNKYYSDSILDTPVLYPDFSHRMFSGVSSHNLGNESIAVKKANKIDNEGLTVKTVNKSNNEGLTVKTVNKVDNEGLTVKNVNKTDDEGLIVKKS
jgi:hypothetical protein